MLLQVAYLAISWDEFSYMISPTSLIGAQHYKTKVLITFFARVAIMILTILFLFELSCLHFDKEEQVC